MHAYQARERKSKTVNNNRSQLSAHRGAAFHPQSNNPVQAQFQQMANSSSHVKQLQAYQRMADNNTVIQKKENKTGMPDRLKAGVERLSGMDLSDVRVHYNSSKPAQLRAMAYAQGTDIYIAPGQEKHLPHEAWHVVQQKQGRVQPTTHTAQKKQSAPTAQLYTTIDLNEAQRWEDVKNAFPAFKPTLVSEGEGETEKYVMKYVEGAPGTSKLHVAESGELAINADDSAQHKVFFIDSGLLATANNQLAAAGSDFSLAPAGARIIIHNHPAIGHSHPLLQVQAIHKSGPDIAAKLKTRCNLYYRNICKTVESTAEIVSTTAQESMKGDITLERKAIIDKALNDQALKAGDAFEIKAIGEDTGRTGWNEHFAGIVAASSPDYVTLENYNREAEFGDKVLEATTARFQTDSFALQNEIDKIKREIRNNDDVDTLKKLSVDELLDLNTKKDKLSTTLAQINGLNLRSKMDTGDTSYFKMYGPASKEQSFVDKWRGEMEKKQSLLNIKKARR